MRDYKELIEALRSFANSYVQMFGSDGCPQLMNDASNAIEDLIAALTASNEVIAKSGNMWTSVKDALPKEERKTYWVYTNDGSQHSCRWTNNRFGLGVSDKWGWSVFDIPQYTVVTHWMNLPEPPAKEDDNG